MFAYAPFSYKVVVADQCEEHVKREEVYNAMASLPYEDKDILFFADNHWGAVDKHVHQIFLGAETPFVAWVHDDVMFVPGNKRFWSLLTGVAGWPQVGMVGPSTNSGEGEQQLGRTDVPAYVKTHSVHVPIVLMRTAFFKEMDGLDLALPWGCGVIDLCMRTLQQGREIVVVRDAYVHHEGAGTLKEMFNGTLSAFLQDYGDISINALVRKHGVRKYVEYLKQDRSKGALQTLWGEYDMREQMKRAAEFPVEAWQANNSLSQ